MSYLDPHIVDDETQLTEETLAAIADRIPGWEPSEGHVEVSLAEAFAIALSTAAVAFKQQAKAAYTGFGTDILGIPRLGATAATAISTWTIDTVEAPTGVVIPAGTAVHAHRPDGAAVELVTVAEVTVGAAVPAVAGVQLVAVDSGPDSNGADGPATPEPLLGVTAVTITSPSSGGRDLEDLDDYASRVAERATRLRGVPVTPEDYAVWALDVAAVARCVALNRYDPGPPPDDDALGHLTLVCVDAAGDPLTSPNKAAVLTYLGSIEHILSVILHIEDPELVDTDVTVTVRAQPAADPDDLQARVEAAITAFLDPATFDADPGKPGGWANPRRTELTIFDITSAIDDLDGLDAVVDVELSAGDGERVALPDPVGLVNLTDLTVTVT